MGHTAGQAKTMITWQCTAAATAAATAATVAKAKLSLTGLTPYGVPVN
jgi:hypothetical protein